MKKIFRVVCVLAGMAAATIPAYALPSYEEIDEAARAGKTGRARDMLTERLSADKRDVVAQVMLGDLYRAMGDQRRAETALRDAMAADPSYPETYFVLAKISVAQQRYDEAGRQFALFKEKMRPLAAAEPSVKEYYLDALRYMSQELLLAKRYAAFRSEAEEILRLDPRDQQTLYNTGVYFYYYAHDRAAAYRSFESARALDPSTAIGQKARYAIEFIRTNPDSRFAPDLSFLDQEFAE